MIKIAIFPSYGSDYVPKSLRKGIRLDIKGRIELARRIEELPISESVSEEVLSKSKEGFVRIKEDSRDLLVCLVNGYEGHLIEVVEVDNSYPWRIRDYDGAEFVEYFLGISVMDKEYNMCSW